MGIHVTVYRMAQKDLNGMNGTEFIFADGGRSVTARSRYGTICSPEQQQQL
jgi:hypothetical protein